MTITRTSETDGTRVLWIDDQIAMFGAHLEDLEDNNFDVISVNSADEALSTIRRGEQFDAIIVDLKMPDVDGIALLERLSDEMEVDDARPRLIVLSSFLYDPMIRRRLVDLNMNVALLEKTRGKANRGRRPLSTRLQQLLANTETTRPTGDQFVKWDQEASMLDPFEISYEIYRDSPMVVRLELDRKALRLTSKTRQALSREGVVWSLFCGSSHEPSRTATDTDEIPTDEEVFDFATRCGHPPYEFYEQGQYEEFADANLAELGDDDAATGCPGAPDFPYFHVSVVHREEGDIAINIERDFHFDSGLDITAFDLETALLMGLTVANDKPTKAAKYDGVDHSFYSLTGDAFIDRGRKGSFSITLNGRAYLDWAEVPFSRRCSEFRCTASDLCFRRYALLGRNLLVENGLLLDLRRIDSRQDG